MKKIASGSIVVNPSDLLRGSAIESVLDRGAFLYSQSVVSWSGSSLTFTGDVEIHSQNSDGTVMINKLLAASSPISLSNDDMVIARITRTSGSTSLISGTYPNLNAGEYAVVNASSLSAVDLLRKDHVVLFWRRDTTSGLEQLVIPLMKQILPPGSSQYIGSAPEQAIKIQYVDPTSTTLPTGASVTIDGSAGVDGDKVLFTNLSSGNNEIYVLGGVGSSITWTALAVFSSGFSPSNGEQVEVLDGTTYADQTGIFNGTSWSFNDTVRYISQSGDFWEQSSLHSQAIVDNSTGIVFSVAQASTNNLVIPYSIVRNGTKEAGHLYITHNGFSAVVTSQSADISSTGVTFSAVLSGGNLELHYASTSTGFPGTMRYFVQRWSDVAGGPSGLPSYNAVSTVPVGYVNAAYAQSDGSVTPVNCSNPTVVGGKTRLQLNWMYTMLVDSGSTVADIDVIVDGLVIPRFISGTTSTAYWREIDPQTIEFWTDLTGTPVSLEVRKKNGSVDVSSSVSARVATLHRFIVGSPAQVLQGLADYSSITTAITFCTTGDSILILNGTYNESVTIDKQIEVVGQGYSTVINGTMTFSSTAARATLEKVKIVSNLVFNASSVGNYVITCWQGSAGTITNSGTDNLYEVIRD